MLIALAKYIILSFVYFAGKMRGKKQWVELPVFLSKRVHRRST